MKIERNVISILLFFICLPSLAIAEVAFDNRPYFFQAKQSTLPEIHEGRLPPDFQIPELEKGTLLQVDYIQQGFGYFKGHLKDGNEVIFRVPLSNGTYSLVDSSKPNLSLRPALQMVTAAEKAGYNYKDFQDGKNSDLERRWPTAASSLRFQTTQYHETSDPKTEKRKMQVFYAVADPGGKSTKSFWISYDQLTARVEKTKTVTVAAAPIPISTPTPPLPPAVEAPPTPELAKTEGTICVDCLEMKKPMADLLAITEESIPTTKHPLLKSGEELDTYMAQFRKDCKLPKEYFDKYKSQFEKAEGAYDLPKEFMSCLALRESRFNAKAGSNTGAYGLLQFTGDGSAEIKRILKQKIQPAYDMALKYFGSEDKLPKNFSKYEKNTEIVIGASGMLLAHYVNQLQDSNRLKQNAMDDDNLISSLSIVAASYNMGVGSVSGVIRQLGSNYPPSKWVQQIRNMNSKDLGKYVRSSSIVGELQGRANATIMSRSWFTNQVNEIFNQRDPQGQIRALKSSKDSNKRKQYTDMLTSIRSEVRYDPTEKWPSTDPNKKGLTNREKMENESSAVVADLSIAKAEELKGHVGSINDCMRKEVAARFGKETASETKCKK